MIDAVGGQLGEYPIFDTTRQRLSRTKTGALVAVLDQEQIAQFEELYTLALTRMDSSTK